MGKRNVSATRSWGEERAGLAANRNAVPEDGERSREPRHHVAFVRKDCRLAVLDNPQNAMLAPPALRSETCVRERSVATVGLRRVTRGPAIGGRLTQGIDLGVLFRFPPSSEVTE